MKPGRLAWLAGILLTAGFAAPATAQPRAGEAAQATGTTTSLSVIAYGGIVSHWRLAPDGSGELWREPPGGPPEQGALEMFRGRLAAEHGAALARRLAALRATPVPPDCAAPMGHGPVYDLRWGPAPADRRRIMLNCATPAWRAYGERLGALDRLVTGHFARDPAPYAVRPPGPMDD